MSVRAWLMLNNTQPFRKPPLFSGKIHMFMKAVFTANIFDEKTIQDLKSLEVDIVQAPGDLKEDELIKTLADADIYILGGHEKASDKVIASSDFKLLCFLGTGFESHVDVATAKRKGIQVTYTPHANAYTVAEFTIALILSVTKNISYFNQLVKNGSWGNFTLPLLKDRTLGIVGMGHIGSRVARIMKNGFGMKIVYASLSAKPDIEQELGAKRLELDDLITSSDVVSLHVKTTEKTVGMLGERELNLFKPTFYLINTSRAEVVDGHALYKALVAGSPCRAGFDVYYIEPMPTKEKDPYGLLSLGDDKFIITPHTAYSSTEANEEMAKMLVESLTDFATGKLSRHLIPEV